MQIAILLLFFGIFFVTSLGAKILLTDIILKNNKYSITIKKLNSNVIFIVLTFISLYVLNIFIKLLTMVKFINGMFAPSLVIWIMIILTLLLFIFGLYKLIVLKWDHKKQILLDFLIFIPIFVVIYFIVTSPEAFNALRRNFITDGRAYITPAIALVKTNSPGYPLYNFDHISLLDFFKTPDKLFLYFYAIWFKMFSLNSIFQMRLMYIFGFSVISWITFLQSFKLFVKNRYAYFIICAVVIVMFITFDANRSWDYTKLLYVMQFISSIIATSIFLHFIFLVKEYFVNNSKLVFIVAFIPLIMFASHSSVLLIYISLLLIVALSMIIKLITKKVLKKDFTFNVRTKSITITWENVLLTCILALFTFALYYINKHIKYDPTYCPNNPCELGYDLQFRWKTSSYLIFVFYALMVFTKDKFYKYFYFAVIFCLIFTRFQAFLIYIDTKYYGFDFMIKRNVAYFMLFGVFLIFIQYLNVVTKNKVLQLLVFIFSFYFIYSWNGIENLKGLITSYAKDNIFVHINDTSINENVELTKYLLANNIEHSTLVAEIGGGDSFTADYKLNTLKDFEQLPISTIGSENWNQIITYQVNKNVTVNNQFNNIFIPSTMILDINSFQYDKPWGNNVIIKKIDDTKYEIDVEKFLKYLNKDFFKIFKFNKQVDKKGYDQNSFNWYQRIEPIK